MAEDLIDREEVVLIMGMIGDIREFLWRIYALLEDENGQEEARY